MAVLNQNRCSTRTRCRTGKSEQSASRLKRKAEKLLATEIAFVHRADRKKTGVPEITDLDAYLVEIRSGSGGDVMRVAPDRSLLPVPGHLLTREQERRLFLHMNYLKCRANALRSRIDPSHPSRTAIDEIEGTLADAKRIQDCLTESNLRLVLSIARKLSNSQAHFEELVSDGLPILMRCVELFDASRGYRFSTYVTHSVQRHLYRVIHRSQRHRQRFAATDDEILSNVPEETDDRPQQMVDHAAIVSAILNDAEAQLDSRERLIIHRRFGLDGASTQTLRQIAGELGISKERVRQLQLRAMDKLQDIALSMNVDADLL